jgi:hypothetical protein
MTSTDMPTLPHGWIFKVENHEGDPAARYIIIREPDVDEAAVAVSKRVPEKLVHVERNARNGEVAGLRPGEIRDLGVGV